MDKEEGDILAEVETKRKSKSTVRIVAAASLDSIKDDENRDFAMHASKNIIVQEKLASAGYIFEELAASKDVGNLEGPVSQEGRTSSHHEVKITFSISEASTTTTESLTEEKPVENTQETEEKESFYLASSTSGEITASKKPSKVISEPARERESSIVTSLDSKTDTERKIGFRSDINTKARETGKGLDEIKSLMITDEFVFRKRRSHFAKREGRFSIDETSRRSSVVSACEIEHAVNSEIIEINFLSDLLLPKADDLEVEDKDDQLLREDDKISLKEDSEQGEKPVPIDREYFYNIYKENHHLLLAEQQKNSYLQKLMVGYFRRRRMEYVLREQYLSSIEDSNKRYLASLVQFGELLETEKTQRELLGNEVKDLTQLRDKEKGQAMNRFKSFQALIRNTGQGLIFTKTGITLSQTYLGQFCKRQELLTGEMSSMRSLLIRLINGVAEKERKTQKIEMVDETNKRLTLGYFEKLKLRNRIITDKLDEREEELSKTRVKYYAALQELSHYRMVKQSNEEDKAYSVAMIDAIDQSIFFARDTLNEKRMERDRFRNETNNLKRQAGLLIYPILLRDMADSIKEVSKLKKELMEIEMDCKAKQTQLKNIRKNIEFIGAKGNVICFKNRLPKVNISTPSLRRNSPRRSDLSANIKEIKIMDPIIPLKSITSVLDVDLIASTTSLRWQT